MPCMRMGLWTSRPIQSLKVGLLLGVALVAACETTTYVVPGVIAMAISPANRTLVQGKLVIEHGRSEALRVTLRDSENRELTGRAITWSASGVVAVNPATGATTTVTANGVGSGSVTASVEDQSSPPLTVVVQPKHVDRIDVDPATGEVIEDKEFTLTARLYAFDGTELTDRTVTWTSGNTAIARVVATDQSGYVATIRGASPGTTAIVSMSEGVSSPVPLEVLPKPVERVAISPSSPEVERGFTAQLTATLYAFDDEVLTGLDVSWVSKNTGVATVDGDGLVTGVAVGTAEVCAVSEGMEECVTVTVVATPGSAVVAVGFSPIQRGQTVQAVAQVLAKDGGELTGWATTWASKSTGVATVDQNGVVRGVAVGTAEICATPEEAEGMEGCAAVAVRVDVERVKVRGAQQVYPGATIQLTATVYAWDKGELDRPVTWRSKNAVAATVARRGLVTGVAEGAAGICAKAEGMEGCLTVTVVRIAVDRVEVSPTTADIFVDATQPFTATAYAADNTVLTGRTVTWTSSDSSVAGVVPSPPGTSTTATAIGPGSTLIRATVEGTTGSAALDVWPVGELVANGDFETGDLTGWTVTSGGGGAIFALSGCCGPISGYPVPPPPQGAYAAVVDQDRPSTLILHQDVFVPPIGTTVFSAIIWVENRHPYYYVDPELGLDYQGGGQNQHFRVDIVNPAASVYDVGAGVLRNVYLTEPEDPTSIGYSVIGVDLTPFKGQTVRLRFAVVDNQYCFNAGVDVVSVRTGAPSPGAPEIRLPTPVRPPPGWKPIRPYGRGG